MSKQEKPEVFTDKWIYGENPKLSEKSRLDYSSLTAMGSCFARNLNRWLNFKGYTNREMPWDILYNPFSIQKEVERSVKPVNWEEHLLHEKGSDGTERFRDPWRNWLFAPTQKELLTLNNDFDRKANVFVKSSTGFLITLGLSEIWSPADNPNIVLNQVPIGSIRLQEKEWASRFASVTEVDQSLEITVNTIRENISQTIPIIFTLSPVPLKYTASGLNIREANNLSKATLLVALKQLTSRRKDIDYFPSYEIVQALTEQSENSTWQIDGRHVTADVVERVSTAFTNIYGQPNVKNNGNMFWIPRVDSNGNVVGKLYVDGTKE